MAVGLTGDALLVAAVIACWTGVKTGAIGEGVVGGTAQTADCCEVYTG